jgi:3-phenylpropionate/cinnamic acid dioxygenase small subunit
VVVGLECARMSELERVASDITIRNVLVLIAQLADTGKVADYVSQFTDDAVWAMPENPTIGLAASERTGRAAIEAGVHERREAGLQGPDSDTMHVVMMSSIEFERDDLAHAHSYFQFYAMVSTNPTLQNMGQYRDTFRRTDDGWKLSRRSITFG